MGFEAEPGAQWRYNTPAYQKILPALAKAAGKDSNALTREWLAGPLGMRHSEWRTRPNMAGMVGFVTTARDDQGRETVLDLVPIGDIQLHPVGRLDMDSEGLLVITNDGHLTGLLTHPRYEVEKEYLVGLDAPISRTDIQRLVRGVEADGDRLRAASIAPAVPPRPDDPEEKPAAPAWALVVLREGKNREIRRMMEAVGRRVFVLRRIRLGPLHLGTLGSGAFRELTPAEVDALYAAGKAAEVRSGGPVR